MEKSVIKNIDRIYIKMEVEGQEVLIINLTRSGGISRMGDGSGEKETLYFAMGRSEEPLLKEWLKSLDDEMLSFVGRYEYPHPKGKICHLSIGLEGNELDTGFAFVYGDESEGPPEEIFHLVENAVLLTDPWYEDQQDRKRQRKARKKG